MLGKALELALLFRFDSKYVGYVNWVLEMDEQPDKSVTKPKFLLTIQTNGSVGAYILTLLQETLHLFFYKSPFRLTVSEF